MTILIVIAEDEEILAKALKEKFESEGFQVMLAHDGEQTLDILKTAPKPSLILLDLIMPNKDGFGVLEEMSRDLTLKTIPVIVLSNLGQDEDIKRALQLGAADYFVKAQHPLSDVVSRVKKFLEKQVAETGSAPIEVPAPPPPLPPSPVSITPEQPPTPSIAPPPAPKIPAFVFVIGIIILIVGLGLLSYFVILPFFAQKQAPSVPAAPAPKAAVTITPLEHRSYFVRPPSAVARLNLSSLDLSNISAALKKEAASKINEGSIKEIVIVNGQGSQIPYSKFILNFFSGISASQLDQSLEKDFTAYLYYDRNGEWPGYIAKIKDQSKFQELKRGLDLSLENVNQLPSFYLTPEGTFSKFKDGKLLSWSTRYSLGSRSGTSFNYGTFGDYFVISASFDGLKLAVQLLGLSS